VANTEKEITISREKLFNVSGKFDLLGDASKFESFGGNMKSPICPKVIKVNYPNKTKIFNFIEVKEMYNHPSVIAGWVYECEGGVRLVFANLDWDV